MGRSRRNNNHNRIRLRGDETSEELATLYTSGRLTRRDRKRVAKRLGISPEDLAAAKPVDRRVPFANIVEFEERNRAFRKYRRSMTQHQLAYAEEYAEDIRSDGTIIYKAEIRETSADIRFILENWDDYLVDRDDLRWDIWLGARTETGTTVLNPVTGAFPYKPKIQTDENL